MQTHRLVLLTRRAGPCAALALASLALAADPARAERREVDLSTHIKTVNGDVRLTLAGKRGARIDARTVNGSIAGDGVTFAIDASGGGPTIDVQTVNGSIDVVRR